MRYVDKYYRDTVGASRLQRWGGVTPGDGAASAARWRQDTRSPARSDRQVSWQFLALTGAQGVNVSCVRVHLWLFSNNEYSAFQWVLGVLWQASKKASNQACKHLGAFSRSHALWGLVISLPGAWSPVGCGRAGRRHNNMSKNITLRDILSLSQNSGT